jgi:hypothetical protein
VTEDQTLLLAVGGLAVLCLVLSVALLVVVLRLRASVTCSSAEVDALRERLDGVHRPPAPAAAPPVEFVITDLGTHHDPDSDPEPVHLDGPAFADVVLRETVVKAASLAHGVRRGLAPATRNRIRFEMKQEVRRARKQRRSDLKAAQRDLHTRQRATLATNPTEGT